MGGTFDPIHFGHLLAAEESLSALRLNEVVFIPTGIPPHKRGAHVTSPEHRFTMTLLAVLENQNFSVSRVEIDREGSSHTVDTLRELRKHAVEDEDYFFITGLDAVLDLESWKEYAVLPELCRIVAVSRPGYVSSGIDCLPSAIRNAIIPLEIPLLSISSTDIRRRVEQGKNIRYLTHESVVRYISKMGLYGRIPSVSRGREQDGK
jgi:nicotinate-nucleotide adenylyltransferase